MSRATDFDPLRSRPRRVGPVRTPACPWSQQGSGWSDSTARPQGQRSTLDLAHSLLRAWLESFRGLCGTRCGVHRSRSGWSRGLAPLGDCSLGRHQM